jgi:large subunit ribosomal protein L25
MLSLKVEKRDPAQKLLEGLIPAVFYGPKEEATSVSVNKKDFEKLWKEAGESSIISLEGVGDLKDSLIQDVQVHPVSGQVLHADFYVIEKGKKLTVSIPLEFIGTSKAVKDLGGTLVKALHEIEVEVLPKDLPQHIEVDIEALVDFDSHISVKDLKLPSGVEVLTEPDESVASVSAPREEEEEPTTTEVDMESIEVEKKGKAVAEDQEESVENSGGE